MFHEIKTKGSVQSQKGTVGFDVQSMGTELSVLHAKYINAHFSSAFFPITQFDLGWHGISNK